ncbi:hypothetical protein MLD38_010801 [Melastoma candidum]|uniref:Uncharacterized protein n=1 Tax=Melastoma candidum TaxID=119954 RepID=A0ACB9R4I3_9MYRT|nr:hypothetical protein MLD38_010801 [Melastoma candidum]
MFWASTLMESKSSVERQCSPQLGNITWRQTMNGERRPRKLEDSLLERIKLLSYNHELPDLEDSYQLCHFNGFLACYLISKKQSSLCLLTFSLAKSKCLNTLSWVVIVSLIMLTSRICETRPAPVPCIICFPFVRKFSQERVRVR